MDVDADKLMIEAIRDGLRSGVKDRMAGYNSPLNALFYVRRMQVRILP